VTRNQKWLLGIFLAFFIIAAIVIFTALALTIFGTSDFKLAGSFGERVGIVEIRGVLLEFPDLQEVLRKVGIGFEVIKSAEHKDIGSPFRRLTEKEREILQEMVDDVFDQFVEVVSSERGLSCDSVLAFADGRIFSGRQAYNLGLVDRTGDFQDAIDTAGRMCGLGENPKTVRVRKKRLSWLELINNAATRLQDPASAMSSPRLLYLFR